jgi:hypothetical protein
MNEESEQILEHLANAKRELRSARYVVSLPEKVREVVRLQAAMLPLIRRQRELHEWERVWVLDDPE